MTRQEMFNKAYLGVLAQGGLGKSATGGCMYTTPDGKHCGVGQLLTPEQLAMIRRDDILNSDTPKELVKANILPADFDVAFANVLQETHDNANDLQEFAEDMTTLADAYGLTVPESAFA